MSITRTLYPNSTGCAVYTCNLITGAYNTPTSNPDNWTEVDGTAISGNETVDLGVYVEGWNEGTNPGVVVKFHTVRAPKVTSLIANSRDYALNIDDYYTYGGAYRWAFNNTLSQWDTIDNDGWYTPRYDWEAPYMTDVDITAGKADYIDNDGNMFIGFEGGGAPESTERLYFAKLDVEFEPRKIVIIAS